MWYDIVLTYEYDNKLVSKITNDDSYQLIVTHASRLLVNLFIKFPRPWSRYPCIMTAVRRRGSKLMFLRDDKVSDETFSCILFLVERYISTANCLDLSFWCQQSSFRQLYGSSHSTQLHNVTHNNRNQYKDLAPISILENASTCKASLAVE